MNNENVATPELRKFFEKLLALKESVKSRAEVTKNKHIYEIYEKLNDLIKEGRK